MSDIDTVFDNNDDDDDSGSGQPSDPPSDPALNLSRALILKNERSRSLSIHGLLKRLENADTNVELATFSEDCLRKGIIRSDVFDEVARLATSLRARSTVDIIKVAATLRKILKKEIEEFVPSPTTAPAASTKPTTSVPITEYTIPIPGHLLSPLQGSQIIASADKPIQEQSKTIYGNDSKSVGSVVQKSLEELSKAEKKEHEEKLQACLTEDEEEKRAIEEIYRRTKAAGKPIRLDPNFRKVKLSDVDQIVTNLLSAQQDHNRKPQ